MKPYTIEPSTSEHKIIAYGRDLKELFSNALFGMFDSIEPIKASDAQAVSRPVKVFGTDRESLLINFLSEALYWASAKHEAFLRAEFDELTDTKAIGRIEGFEVAGFEGSEIKAVTHHGVKITNEDDVLQTPIVLDV